MTECDCYALDHGHRQECATNKLPEPLASLEAVLSWRDAMSEDDPGYPAADPGCIVCTAGTVPNKYNTGLCPWHSAERVVREAQTDTRARSEKERT